MSDEQGGAPTPEPGGSGLDAITGRLNSPGELIIALGAVLVVFVDLLGNLILEEYSFNRVAWAASLLILFAVAAHRWSRRTLWKSPSPVVRGSCAARTRRRRETPWRRRTSIGGALTSKGRLPASASELASSRWKCESSPAPGNRCSSPS